MGNLIETFKNSKPCTNVINTIRTSITGYENPMHIKK